MLIGAGDLEDGVHYFKSMHGGLVFVAAKKEDYIRWHQCLGHALFGTLASLSSVCEFKFNNNSSDCCNVCNRAKQTHSFCLSNSRANKPFDLVHYDLWRRYHTPSSSGCHYFQCLVNDFCCTTWVDLLRDKREAYKSIV